MITISLTSFEHRALRMAGNAADDGIEDFLFLTFLATGARNNDARGLAEEYSAAALRARRKIAEATRYEIVEENE